ncbi:hypothetical protein ACFV1C_10495 [Streptomyces sp. NPDC059605]|uniref:hypothetical protein n=1 Tax=unclassified Streptomyces TaxID=2593676 RepID=UPI0036D18C2A
MDRGQGAGGVGVADPGGEHRHGVPDVVHRLAQPGRDLPGAGLAQRRPRRFGAVLLVLVLLGHDSIVLRTGGHHQGVQRHGRGHGPASCRYAGRAGIGESGMELPERVGVLPDVACEVWEAVVEGRWSPSEASDTLAAVDVLVDALACLGPEFAGVLAPALTATAAARALLVNAEDGCEVPCLRSTSRAAAGQAPAGRHTVPEFWNTWNMAVAEQLWWGEQEGRGGPLTDMFAALPPRAMEEAVTRRLNGEDWHQVLEDLTRRHAS